MAQISLRGLPVKIVCLGSAVVSAAYYAHLGSAVHVAAAVGLGVIAGAVDLVKPQMLKAVATKGAGTMKRASAGLIFVVLFVASMVAIDGMLLQMRSMLTGPRAQAITDYDRTLATYQTAVRELKQIEVAGPVRPVAQIAAALSGAPINVVVWRRTAQCTDVTKPASATACEPVIKLREEMARANRKVDLEQRRDAAQKLLATITRPAAADPQAEALANLTGQSETMVAYLLIAIIGLALELVSCFGRLILDPVPPAKSSLAEREVIDITPAQEVPTVAQVTSAESAAKAKVMAMIQSAGGTLRTQNNALADALATTPSTLCRWRRRWEDEINSHVENGVLVMSMKRRNLRLAFSA